jgi:hypothetical protein
MVKLIFHYVNGESEAYYPVGWEYHEAHAGYHPAEYTVFLEEPDEGINRHYLRIHADNVLYIEIDSRAEKMIEEIINEKET